MLKTNLSDIFSDLNTESSVILPKSIKIKNIKGLDTISDATSSFMPQKGGYLNGTKNKDINQLISMLSATSDDNYTANSTDTEQLKNKLFNIIQSGGRSDPFQDWDKGESIPTIEIEIPTSYSRPVWRDDLSFSEEILKHLLVPILNIINDTENKKWYIIFLYNTFITYPSIQQIQFMKAINMYLYYYNDYDELKSTLLYIQNILKKMVRVSYVNIPPEFSTVFDPVPRPLVNYTYPKFLINNTVDGYLSHNPPPLY